MISKRKNEILSFLIPVAIFFAACIALGVTPFGDETLMISDANGYYVSDVTYLENILKGDADPLYTFTRGVGNSSIGWKAYVNPLAYLMLLFAGTDNQPLVFTLFIALCEGFAGLFMFFLLKDIYGNRSRYLLLSTAYALMGFMVVNNFNLAVFWAGPLMLPLMTLGLRRIFQNKSPLLYIISIAISLMIWVQMGFAVCTASVLFFAVKTYLSWDEIRGVNFRNIALRYALSSVLGGALSAVFWLPELIEMQGSRASQIEMSDFSFTDNAPLLSMAARFFSGASSYTQLVQGFPAVFCGILPLALLLLFFFNRKMEQKKKYALGALLAFYALSFYIHGFTSILQGFTHANWFPYRYSFVFTFLILLAAAEEMRYLWHIPLKHTKRAGIWLLIAAILIFSQQYEFIDGSMAVADLALLGVMGLSYRYYRKKPSVDAKKIAAIMLLLCTSLQLYLNYYVSYQSVINVLSVKETDFQETVQEKSPLVRDIQMADDTFYRMVDENQRTRNDAEFFNYNGVGWSGHQNYETAYGLKQLGLCYSGLMSLWYDAGVPAAADSLLGIRYLISERDLTVEKGYLKADGVNIYTNPYALPIAFLTDDAISEIYTDDTMLENHDLFSLQNELWQAMTGEKAPLFIRENDYTLSVHNADEASVMTADEIEDAPDPNLNEESADTDIRFYQNYIEVLFTAKRSGPVYLYFYNENNGNAVGFSDEEMLQCVGVFEKGEKATARIATTNQIGRGALATVGKNLCLYYADMEQLGEYSAILRGQSAFIQKETDSKLSGTVTADAPKKLFFTIPYNESWTLTIDGEKTKLDKTLNLFVAADMPAGQHTYTLSFMPRGLMLGGAISGISLFAVVIWCSVLIRRRRDETV